MPIGDDAGLDPFTYHPELRDQIIDPTRSFFRNLTTADFAARAEEWSLPFAWWFSDAERETRRAAVMAGHWDRDLWVFGYGSLMWDPGFRFAEVRRGHVPDYARRFIFKDVTGARGTLAAPGLMAALDRGPGCDGLVFRIPQDQLAQETEVLWRREQIGPAYRAVFVDAHIAGRTVTALAFLADHDVEWIYPDLSREHQIELIATGRGFFGSSLEYLQNIADRLGAIGIIDAEVAGLLRETEVYRSSRPSADSP